MSTKIQRAAVGVGILVIVILLGTHRFGYQSSPNSAMMAAYPPIYPTSTPTPTPDAYGYFSSPDTITTLDTTIPTSDFPDMIDAIDTALIGEDLDTLAGYLAEEVEIHGFETLDTGAILSPQEAIDIVDELYFNGSVPLVQGYYVDAVSGCARVYITGWQGDVTVTGHVGGIGGVTLVHGPAMMWRSCQTYGDPGMPRIAEWLYGQYYDMLEFENTEYGMTPYHRIVP